jgi:hypothetical protein
MATETLNPDQWRRVHTQGGEFIGLAYIPPYKTQSQVENEWRQRMPNEKLSLMRITSRNGYWHDRTPFSYR